jgi:hypothetical protein
MRPLFGMPRDPLQNMRDLLCQNVRQNNWSPRGRHLPERLRVRLDHNGLIQVTVPSFFSGD